MRNISIIALCALAVTACSKATPDGPQDGEPANGTKERAGSDVAPTAVPGVALTYAYRYRLPVGRLVSVQEQHATACEALGPERCRVVGMHYAALANRTITASLSLRLAPTLARQFGKSATAATVAAGGMLAEASIDSVDAGKVVSQAKADTESLTAEEGDLQNQLAGKSLPEFERAQLQARSAALRDAARSVRQTAMEAASKLAETPLDIQYDTGAIDPGFSDGPLLGAVKDGWANIISGVATIVLIAVTLAPWLLALALLVGIWSRVRRPVRRLLGLTEDES